MTQSIARHLSAFYDRPTKWVSRWPCGPLGPSVQ